MADISTSTPTSTSAPENTPSKHNNDGEHNKHHKEKDIYENFTENLWIVIVVIIVLVILCFILYRYMKKKSQQFSPGKVYAADLENN